MYFASYIIESLRYLNVQFKIINIGKYILLRVDNYHIHKSRINSFLNSNWVRLEDCGNLVTCTKLEGFSKECPYYKQLHILNKDNVEDASVSELNNSDSIEFTHSEKPLRKTRHYWYWTVEALKFPIMGDFVREVCIKCGVIPDLRFVKFTIHDLRDLRYIEVRSKDLTRKVIITLKF